MDDDDKKHFGVVIDGEGRFVGVHGPDEPCPADTAPSAGSGPAKVNSTAYRNNWDGIFSKKPKENLPN